MIGWFAFGLALTSLVLWACLIVACRLAWRRARPYVQSFAPMLSAMMPAAGSPAATQPAAAQSAATPDRCEYDDHEWFPLDSPSMHGYGGPAHYCARCGFTEHVPGL